MKTINHYLILILSVITMPLSSAFANVNLAHLNLTISIPAEWQSQIVREDYENQSLFSLKTANESTAFLFSVTKVTGEQWMKVKNQINGYTIIENKDGFITFVQKTKERNINGSADSIYRNVLSEVDRMIGSIELK